MSDTVLIALITFLSGAVGAIAGVVGSHISSKNAATVEMNKTVFATLLEKRLEAYGEFYGEYSAYLLVKNDKENPKRVEQGAKLGTAISKATIVASSETEDALSDMLVALIREQQRGTVDGELGEKEVAVRTGMKRDLHSFAMPRVEKQQRLRSKDKKRQKGKKKPKGKIEQQGDAD